MKLTFDCYECIDRHGLWVVLHGGQLVEQAHSVLVLLRGRRKGGREGGREESSESWYIPSGEKEGTPYHNWQYGLTGRAPHLS